MSPTDEVCEISVGSGIVKLLAKDDRVVWHERREGFEPQTLKTWAEICEAAEVVLDIGSYTGLYAIAAVKFRCIAVAFEPQPVNRKRLQANCDINSAYVQIRPEAVSDTSGAGSLYYNSRVPLTAGASLVKRPPHTVARAVTTIAIDEMNLEAVSAVKIDVEGTELAVFRGMRDTLSRCRPIIIVEILKAMNIGAVMRILHDYTIKETLDRHNFLMVPN
jgi:FkbM family methyltransferase